MSMDTFLSRYRNLIVLAAILFAQIIALAVQVRRPTDEGETRLIRVWAISAVAPLGEGRRPQPAMGAEPLHQLRVSAGVRRENRELRAEIERMKIEDARLDEDARMARRVQALLGFKEQYVDSTVAAQVIGTSGSEQSRVLYVDKGSNDGIKPDMAVITPTGIVGKIVQVAPEWSQVLPINDQFSGVGAALKDSRLQGILKGAPNGATTLQYIMSDEKVVPGEDGHHQRRRPHLPQGLARREGRLRAARQGPLPQHSRDSLVASRPAGRGAHRHPHQREDARRERPRPAARFRHSGRAPADGSH